MLHTDTEWAPAGNVCGSGPDPVKSLKEINFPGLFSEIKIETELQTWGMGNKSENDIYFKGIKYVNTFLSSFICPLFQQ